MAVDTAGRVYPMQKTSGGWLFVAPAVPALGYEVFRIREGRPGEGQQDGLAVDEEKLTVESPRFKLAVDPRSGTIARLEDKAGDRLVLGSFPAGARWAIQPRQQNLFEVHDDVPHDMSAWTIGAVRRIENVIEGATCRVVESGPVRAVIRILHAIRSSAVEQDLVVYRDLPRIDFETTVDWQERSDHQTDGPMLEVAFTPDLTEARATREIPFGYYEREADGQEVPALQWIDLSEVGGGYGVSLLNDAKYGYDLQGNTMRLTVVRTPYSPHPAPDVGRQSFTYALYPHRGDWRDAQTVRRAEELNHKLVALVLDGPPGGRAEGGPATADPPPGARFSFLTLEPHNLVVSGLKQGRGTPPDPVPENRAPARLSRARMPRRGRAAGASGADLRRPA